MSPAAFHAAAEEDRLACALQSTECVTSEEREHWKRSQRSGVLCLQAASLQRQRLAEHRRRCLAPQATEAKNKVLQH